MPKLGRRSERAELDYQMAPDLVRKDAPFGTLDTPTITMKIIGGKQVPVMYHHPHIEESYGSRIQPLQPITEKPNHLDPRTYGDNPSGYYNNVQPTAFVNKRPDSKDFTRQHYKALPPIQANRTRNDMSTVFEAETWTANHNPPLAKETEYKTNYFSDIQSNEMEHNNYSSQIRDPLVVTDEEYDRLKRFLPANVFLPSEPIKYPRLEENVLYRLIAHQLGNCDAKTLKSVYLDASTNDTNMRGFCSLEALDNSLRGHGIKLRDLRLVAAQYVDSDNYPGKINYEQTLTFLSKALDWRGKGSNDRPKYFKSNGETAYSLTHGSIYKDREVAKLLRTVENELSKNSFFMDWTKWNSAFNRMDRDHRETLSASQIKDICYDNRLPLSDSILNQILALCEDNNRDGQYRWSEFLDFLSRVRPSNTGLPIPRHSPRKESPQRDPSPTRGGYTDRFDGPPAPPVGYSGRDYGYSHRDGYGLDDYQKQGQYRYDDRTRGDREYQIKQLSSELKDLEAKYHMTQEAMKSHDKPWLDRYLKLAEALYNSDATNKGCLPRNVVIDIVEKYNDACNLGLDMNYARMVTFTPGNVDRSGNVLLKPYLTNLSGGRKRPGDDGTQTRY